jgi:hypothetical protein
MKPLYQWLLGVAVVAALIGGVGLAGKYASGERRPAGEIAPAGRQGHS